MIDYPSIYKLPQKVLYDMTSFAQEGDVNIKLGDGGDWVPVLVGRVTQRQPRLFLAPFLQLPSRTIGKGWAL